MKPIRCLLLLPVTAAMGVAWSGCVNAGPDRKLAERRMPAMPTVGPPPAATGLPVVVPETEMLAAVTASLRRNDISGALQAVATVRDQAVRARVLTESATAVAPDNPAAVAGLAAALPAGALATSLAEKVGRALVRREAETAVNQALQFSDSAVRATVLRSAAGELVKSDPRAAIDRVMALPTSANRDEALGIMAAAWARQDLEATISWLRGLPDDPLRQRLTSGVGFEIAQSRPDRAVSLAEMLPPGRDRLLLLSAIGQTWVALDTQAALSWVGRLPAGEQRDAAYVGVETGLGVPRTRRIAGAPVTRGTSRTRGGVGAGAATSLPVLESPDFKAWRATQPSWLSGDEAILEYVRQRGALEPATMGTWLATLPGGPTRDRAMEIYVDNVVPTAPAEAARWIRALPRSERNDEMIEKTARRWLLTSPDAAAAWLQDTTLPPYRKEQLLREVGR